VLLECIEQASAKAIVVVPFKGIMASLYENVGKRYSCEIVNGEVSTTKRNEIFRRFKQEADPHVLLCHPKVMAHGLNLTEADMTIFYGPIYSNDQSQQVMERFNRPGQKRNMTVVRLGAMPLEWEIYARVESNRVSQETILDLYKLALVE
jgi:SNF2 family DNA or RNA helicase